MKYFLSTYEDGGPWFKEVGASEYLASYETSLSYSDQAGHAMG